MSWISPFLFLTIDAQSVLFMSKQNMALNHFVGREKKHFLCQLLKKCIPFFNFAGHRKKNDQTKAGALFSLVWAFYQLLRRNKNKNKMIKQEIGFIPTLKHLLHLLSFPLSRTRLLLLDWFKSLVTDSTMWLLSLPWEENLRIKLWLS